MSNLEIELESSGRLKSKLIRSGDSDIYILYFYNTSKAFYYILRPNGFSLIPAWDGRYDKKFHIVITHTGERVRCWPNAGKMVALDNSGREWSPGSCYVEEEVDESV